MKGPVGILIDTTRCTGCERCVLACREENDLGVDRLAKGASTKGGLSATRLSTVLRLPGNHFVRQQCRHCLDPACVSVCPVGALTKTPEGPVVYDDDRCMGCRYCMMACPYGIPRYQWDRAAPYVRKCSLCHHRVVEGKAPACVEACPEKVMLFGPRDEILAEARRRIAAEPERYVPRIDGEHEVGGTSVLYISDISLGFLSWNPELTDQPLPELSWAALRKVPLVILGVGGLMAAIYWIIGRRMQLAAEGVSPEGPAGTTDRSPPEGEEEAS